MPRCRPLALLIVLVAMSVWQYAATAFEPPTRPLVIAHRGSPGSLPEHTLEGYALAIEHGADFVEPDLVATGDGALIARHEPYLGGDNADFAGADSTDVASRPEFASRKKSVVLDGVTLTGWFAEDFTLAEVKTLRARERLPALRPSSASRNGEFGIPTLQEIIDLVRQKERETGRKLGIYPETKHPSYHEAIGLPLERRLVALLRANGFTDPARVFIQSFEVGNLRLLNTLIDVPLAQLFAQSGQPYDFVSSGDARTYDDLASPAGLAFVATYADAVGPDKARVIPVIAGSLGKPTSFVRDAHARKLRVHPYTFRSENTFLPGDLRSNADPTAHGDYAAEYAAFFAAGVDGVFSDHVEHALRARDGRFQD